MGFNDVCGGSIDPGFAINLPGVQDIDPGFSRRLPPDSARIDPGFVIDPDRFYKPCPPPKNNCVPVNLFDDPRPFHNTHDRSRFPQLDPQPQPLPWCPPTAIPLHGDGSSRYLA